MKESKSMTLAEVRDTLGCEVLVAPEDLTNVRVLMGGGADLMSDVLAFLKGGAVLLTGLTNVQAIRTAEVADVRAIVYVRSKRPDEGALALAHELRLPLMATNLPMFEACGRLHRAGLRGCMGGSANELPQGV